jgi:tRNA(His) guanylyltransferase
MANTRFQYVRDFESEVRLLPNTWIVVRVDGNGFSEFVKNHYFKKPIDQRGVDLMCACADALCRKYRDVRLAFGQSDEFSFVLSRECELWGRREAKIVSSFASFFAASFVFLWPRFFDEPMKEIPCFDGRVVLFPSTDNLRDYLSWRQADTHINHLLNCCFWALVEKKQLSPAQAQQRINGTTSAQKNELLYEVGVNYNDQPPQHRKGSTLFWTAKTVAQKSSLILVFDDLIQDDFWKQNSHLLEK